MSISAQEYRYRTSELASLDFEDATSRLAGFVEWLDSDASAGVVLKELRSRDVQPLLEAAGFQNPPKAKTPEDVAAIGLAIIELAVKQQTEIFQIGFAIGVRSTSSRIQDTSDEIMRRYMRPLMKYIDVRLFAGAQTATSAQQTRGETMNTTDVFIVHGRDEGPKQTVARFVEHLGLRPIVLHEQSNRGRTIIEKFEDHAEVQFAIVILTPDDVGRLATEDNDKLRARARQNVVFEMGYFIGRIRRSHVFPLKAGVVEIPSDYAGVAYTDFDAAGAWKVQLARELKAAGFLIDANKAFL
jgi:predicted nucleotide-binding protein